MPMTNSPVHALRARIRPLQVLALTAALLVSGCKFTDESTPVPIAYTLGGTVSGLQASGLALANDGQRIDVSSGAASFTFGAVLPSHAAYAVTVATQPTGENCSVANGSGVGQGANVGNVVVTCATVSEPLGGTLTGLSVAGLVLANGSDTVAPAANAPSFTMPTAVAVGSTYDVVVKTQPPGLACAVTGGMSTMPASPVTTVAVTCTDQPFTLGGMVSGLTTTGLVLANGSDLATVPANATTFVMPTKVAFGTTYTVTVHAQPTGLNCSVSQATAPMPANDVTSVVVTCADRSYQLGGHISGLTATGLILLNGSDSVPVPANASRFTLPTAVAYGTHYLVTVGTQPSGLFCNVSNGSATMPANDVTTVSVACGTTTHTIGGTVSGLTTSGLVLVNGSDTLPVAANAIQFTLPTGEVSGSTYAVTVQTQPSGLFCAVTNGTGPVTNADISSIQISCTPSTVSFTSVGLASYVVPAGVTSIQVVATGGGGGGGGGDSGGGAGSPGGKGGIVTSTLTVSPGDTLALSVGGGGHVGAFGVQGGFGGGGGGGGSSNVTVNGSTATQVIAGGGGGGFGYADGQGYGGDGNGGNADVTNYGAGGYGGANGIGGAGGDDGMGDVGNAGNNGNGGAGGAGTANGSSIAGGIGGSGDGSGIGGAGPWNCSGGGGGGYGGGGVGFESGGGGGGSTGPTGTTYTLAANAGASGLSGGNGSIVITVN